MFGLILSSRPVQVSPTALTPTQFAFTLPSSPPFSHLVVFLLPGAALPPDTAAAVYIQLPSAGPEFRFLGAIANEKQSAIFKVNAGNAGGVGAVDGAGAGVGEDVDAMVDDAETGAAVPGAAAAAAAGENVVVGISIEPVAQVSALLANLKTSIPVQPPTTGAELVRAAPPAQRSPVPTKVLAQRIIANAFNFLASFAGTTGPAGQEVVPLKSFQDWWTKFEKRIERDPGFLEREDVG